jgi:GGDEF domain-containing protein
MSIGIALYPEHGIEEKQLLKHADEAMYLAKKNGRHYRQPAACNTE